MEEEKAKGLIMAARAHWFADEAGAAGTASAAAPVAQVKGIV
jgi:threonine aldolase